MLTKPSALTFRTQTGLEVYIRPLSPEDAPYLADLFAHMSAESRYLRFNQTLSNLDPQTVQAGAQQLARVDPEEGSAWLAFADLPDQPHAPLGGVRFICTAPGVAEASVAVRDDMQRQGIGSMLLEFLVREARRAGIHTLVAVVQHTNIAIWQLLKKSGLPYHRHSIGAFVELTLDITALPS
ncbi:MAG: hypothetical protein Fur0021_38700 [Candidatus Promineifilaceae bacterium]